ncbi:MAG TPA: extracellular solute-binding protein [Planctomycetota bacterium]|nr:extracellular solute-binding protein [Planctomycetota bacterium]
MRNAIVSLLALAPLAAGQEGGEVSVYVSHDEDNARPVLELFEKETGIHVNARYDAEATKTIGLVRMLIEEKGDPQADVYWNNELVTTAKLKQDGVLQPFDVPNATSIPAAYKDPDGMWVGFGARARILIVNTNLVPAAEMPTSMWDLTKPKWKGKVCMALPETGTTAAHCAVLFTLDRAMADEYFNKLIANDCVWLKGNGHTAREVAAGRFAFGWTDTDDYWGKKLEGQPVTVVYPDSGKDQVGVLYIPNSLVLIKGAKHRDAALALIDWLLRPETEAMLAKSPSAQIPVRPDVPVPENVRRPGQIGKAMQVDWDRVGREYDKWVGHFKAKQAAAAAEGGQDTTLTWIVTAVVIVAVGVVVVLRRLTATPT